MWLQAPQELAHADEWHVAQLSELQAVNGTFHNLLYRVLKGS
jgi:hypothetical protein